MTAPSIKEALEQAEAAFEAIRLILINNLEEPERTAFWMAVSGRDKARAALATFQPEGERREAIALALSEKWPGDYMQGDDECEREPNALAYETADLILASGLVQENKK